MRNQVTFYLWKNNSHVLNSCFCLSWTPPTVSRGCWSDETKTRRMLFKTAYVRALKGFKQFRGGNPRAWILTIVRNTAHSWLKKHPGNADIIPFNEAIHHPPAEESPFGEPYEERVCRLHEALDRLSVEYREILVLRDIEGWSYEQLATALKLPPGTVMSRLNRARQRLREEIAKSQHEESRNEV